MRKSRATGRKAEYDKKYQYFKDNLSQLKSLSHSKIARRVGVSKSTISRWMILEGLGQPTHEAEERRRKIRAHPLFGEAGQPAPCIARILADKIGIGLTTVTKMRKAAGVEPPIMYRTKSDGDYRRYPTRIEKEMFELIKIPWPRPPGIDRHLEYLSER